MVDFFSCWIYNVMKFRAIVTNVQKSEGMAYTESKYSRILLLLLFGKINFISQTYIVQDYLHFINSF